MASNAEIEFGGISKLIGMESWIPDFSSGSLSGVRSLVSEPEGAAATRALALYCDILSDRFDCIMWSDVCISCVNKCAEASPWDTSNRSGGPVWDSCETLVRRRSGVLNLRTELDMFGFEQFVAQCTLALDDAWQDGFLHGGYGGRLAIYGCWHVATSVASNDACLLRRLEWFGRYRQVSGHGNTLELAAILHRAKRGRATYTISELANETVDRESRSETVTFNSKTRQFRLIKKNKTEMY